MSVYLQDPDVTIHQGDALETLRSLPSESVHMCVTSPPFYGLRDYGTGEWEGGDEDCDHIRPATGGNPQQGANKGNNGEMAAPFRDVCGKCGARRVDQQIGLEATPDLWVARLVEVFREVRRVLRDDGTLWVEVGDSYAGSWGAQSRENGTGSESLSASQIASHPKATQTGSIPAGSPYKPKDLIGAPWLLAFALRADGWYLRSEIIWAKPNPMPESVTDRPTTSHSRVFMLAKQPRYFYDAEALREPHVRLWDSNAPNGRRWAEGQPYAQGPVPEPNPAGRNRRTVWTIATQPYPEAHFATWPEALCRDMILAGTSERGVCPECGKPWQRIVEREPSDWQERKANGEPMRHGLDSAAAAGAGGFAGLSATTIGWQPGCACDVTPLGGQSQLVRAPTPAVVLDPFIGSGTTALVARRLGRRTIGIELSPTYCQIAARRTQQQSLFA